MNRDFAQLSGLLNLRTRLFESLTNEINQGLEASIAMNIEAIQIHDRRKVEICQEIHRLHSALAVIQRGSAASPAAKDLDEALKTDVQIRQLWRESEAARAEAGRRNRIYEEFLRQAEGTVKVMMNVMSHCLGVYPASVGALPRERNL
ncbi:MAG: hypothetical protein KGM47_12745 [Acidobacteriota bacterium]|nr:hypothetical protein [Acidobacteriota bacterium]